jgi:hypothetical protein
MDAAAMQMALERTGGAIVLFDFRAAFPSIAHDNLFDALRQMGLPRCALNLVASLYDQNICRLSYKGNQSLDSA